MGSKLSILLLWICVVPFIPSFSQCIKAKIELKGNFCVGASQLHLLTEDSIIRIDWYKGNMHVDSALQITNSTEGITVAGGNGTGSSSSQFYGPFKFFIDSTGTIYVADQGNSRIQKWAPGSSVGETVAGGNGQGDGANQINQPTCVFVDDAGAIYVGDNVNARVQKWLPGATSGETVAGGNGKGTAANQFLTITSIFVDKQGAIFIGDLTAERVQKWVPGATSGITAAGGNGRGSAANQLFGPADIFVDAEGALYVADGGNYRVQKWLPNALEGITVAGGNGVGAASNQFNGVSGVSVDKAGNIYISDASNHRVQKWPPGASEGITVAGGNGNGSASNQFSYPNDVHIDVQGNIYIMDFYNSRVQKWTQFPIIDTIHIPKAAGLYYAVVTNAEGCKVTTNEIEVNPVTAPTISIVLDKSHICAGELVKFSASVTNEGLSPSFQWRVNGEISGTNHPDFSTNDLSNNDTITCLLTSSESCPIAPMVLSNAVLVRINSQVSPEINIQPISNSFCKGELVEIVATTTHEGDRPIFQWLVNGTIVSSDGPLFSSTTLQHADSIYCILISDALCVTSNRVSSNLYIVSISSNKPVIEISPSDTTICEGELVRFETRVSNVTGPIQYSWSINRIPAIETTPDFQFSNFSNNDTVICLVQESGGCTTSSTQVVIKVSERPVVTFSNDYVSYPPQGVQLNPTITGNIATYNWSPIEGLNHANIETPIANPFSSTQYFLRVISTNGCHSYASVWVRPVKGLFIPNSFSPNKDGLNDVFYVLGGGQGDSILQFLIFDRWGGTAFRLQDGVTNDPSFGWDGTIKGVKSPSGIYQYLVRVKTAIGETLTFKGKVTLLR